MRLGGDARRRQCLRETVGSGGQSLAEQVTRKRDVQMRPRLEAPLSTGRGGLVVLVPVAGGKVRRRRGMPWDSSSAPRSEIDGMLGWCVRRNVLEVLTRGSSWGWRRRRSVASVARGTPGGGRRCSEGACVQAGERAAGGTTRGSWWCGRGWFREMVGEARLRRDEEVLPGREQRGIGSSQTHTALEHP